ncbi:TVP38/TMEM64 family protein [Verrucomicrobia bacterium S94]|nr:TVP38/TMEM64 family protein [Verrucomicrobia bacterium S94]
MKWIKPLMGIMAIIAILFLGAKYSGLQQWLADALAWTGELGPVGMGIFLLLYITACVFFIPGSLLTLGAGAIYGLAVGSVLVSVSSTLGATAAFLIGRYFARDWIVRKIEGNRRFTAIDDAVAEEGWRIVGLTRLSPVFSFNLLNYAYGLTRVSLREYVLASWIGMMPGTVMYVYIGSLAGDLAGLGAETAEAPSGVQWAINLVAFLATILVTVYVTKIAKKSLSEKIDA